MVIEARVWLRSLTESAAASRVSTSIGSPGRTAQHLVDPLDETFRHDVLELFGLVVHFRPAHAHHLDEEQLDEAMPTQDAARELFAAGRQTHPAVGLVLGESRFREGLHHRGRRARRHPERGGDLSHRHQPIAARQSRLALMDGLQVVFDGARRKHAAGIMRRLARRFIICSRAPRCTMTDRSTASPRTAVTGCPRHGDSPRDSPP